MKKTKKQLGPLFWAESILAGFSTFLVILTLAWLDWIEGIFGFDPDHDNGSFEWELVAVCCVLAVLCSTLARPQWRRSSLATS